MAVLEFQERGFAHVGVDSFQDKDFSATGTNLKFTDALQPTPDCTGTNQYWGLATAPTEKVGGSDASMKIEGAVPAGRGLATRHLRPFGSAGVQGQLPAGGRHSQD